MVFGFNILLTSMRKVGELRTLQIGSPCKSVKRESFPLGPTSHIFSTASTLSLSLLGSNSLTFTTTTSPITNSLSLTIEKKIYQERRRKKKEN